MHDDFRAQVAGNEILKSRFDVISAYIIDAVFQKHGVKITADDVVRMPVARLSTYADSDDYVTGWADEAVLAPSVQKAKERERLQEALEDGDTPEAREVAARLAGMTGAERIAWARSSNVGVTAKKQADARGDGRTPEKTAELIRKAESLPAGMRLAFCRQNGLK